MPGHSLRIHLTSSQLRDGSNWLVGPLGERPGRSRCRERGRQDCRRSCACREGRPNAQRGLVATSRILASVTRGRHRHAVLDVAMALADDLQVEGQHQGAALGRDGALDQRAREVAVAHHIELEPDRLLHRRSDVFEGTDRHGRQAERHAGRLGSAGCQDLAVAMLHAGEAGRRQSDGQRDLLAEQHRRRIAVGNIDHDALAQFQGAQVVAVGAQGLLVVGAAVGIFEKGARDPASVNLTEVLNASNVAHWKYLQALVAPSESGMPRFGWRPCEPSYPWRSMRAQAEWRLTPAAKKKGPASACSSPASSTFSGRRVGFAAVKLLEDAGCDVEVPLRRPAAASRPTIPATARTRATSPGR